jgi:hypothetical protein
MGGEGQSAVGVVFLLFRFGERSGSDSYICTCRIVQEGVISPFVKNCTLRVRAEITMGIGLTSGPTGLTLDKSSI